MGNEAANPKRDLFSELVQDHAQIEMRLKALEQAAEKLSRDESDAAALVVVKETLHYFKTEGARHEAREERILFPHLRPLPEFKQILSALEFQHRMNGTATQELAECVARLTHGQGLVLRRLAIRFVEMHRGHAVAEERALFPLAAAQLAPEVLAAMSHEKS